MKYRQIVVIALTTAIVLILSALYILKPRSLMASSDPQAGPSVARAADLGSTPENCDSIVNIARDLQRRRAVGLTEDQALAELSARGRGLLGFVVEGVFRADPDTSETIVLHAIWEKCSQSGRFGARQ
jgi:hypothetical protein